MAWIFINVMQQHFLQINKTTSYVTFINNFFSNRLNRRNTWLWRNSCRCSLNSKSAVFHICSALCTVIVFQAWQCFIDIIIPQFNPYTIKALSIYNQLIISLWKRHFWYQGFCCFWCGALVFLYWQCLQWFMLCCGLRWFCCSILFLCASQTMLLLSINNFQEIINWFSFSFSHSSYSP